MQRADVAAEAIKAAPPITVAAASVSGATLNELVLGTTLVYVVLQISFLLYRWYRLHRGTLRADD